MNCKEYIGAVVDSIIQSKYDNTGAQFPCKLHQSDSTTSVGWMHKSNHDPEDAPIHNAIARYHARHTMSIKACNYSQHIPGSENVVTDCLSRDFHLSDAQIVAMLTSVHPSLNGAPIQIVPVPDEVISWIASLAQLKPVPSGSLVERTPSTLAAGISGWNSSGASDTTMTPIWTPSSHPTAFASAVLSSMQGAEVTLGEPDPRSKSPRPLPKRPSIMWLRPSSQVLGPTQPSTPAAEGTSTSDGKSPRTREQTPQ